MIEMIEIILFLILISIGILLIKHRFEQRADLTKKPQTSPSRISGIWTAITKDMLSTFVVAVVLLIIGSIIFNYWQNNLESPEREFSFSTQAEFQQNFDQASGSWQVNGNCLRGAGEIRLKNSENLKWWKIKISPCEKEFSDATVKVGNYNFNYWIYEDSRSSLYGAVTKKYFAGNIRYGTMELDPVGGRMETFGSAPVPVTVISDKSFVYPKSPDLKILAGDTKVVLSRSYLAAYAGAPADSPVQGTISFYFGANAGISKIEIW
jgi:hypothetical protein